MTKCQLGSSSLTKQFLILSLIVLFPLVTVAEVTPKSECPKKGKGKADSLAIVEEEELLPASEYDLKHNVMEEDLMDYPMAKPSRTAVTTKPKAAMAQTEIDEETVESPLSFNLVYYIFEKFKFSSSVEPQ